VKIRLYHNVCQRDLLVQQIVDSGGHCPWDGTAFTSEYTAIITEALQTVETAGTVLRDSLETIAGVEPNLEIYPQTILGPLQAQLDAISTAADRVPVP
jgi:hypothetical protein